MTFGLGSRGALYRLIWAGADLYEFPAFLALPQSAQFCPVPAGANLFGSKLGSKGEGTGMRWVVISMGLAALLPSTASASSCDNFNLLRFAINARPRHPLRR